GGGAQVHAIMRALCLDFHAVSSLGGLRRVCAAKVWKCGHVHVHAHVHAHVHVMFMRTSAAAIIADAAAAGGGCRNPPETRTVQ
ncbi:MAG: hypothetical protein OD918_06930, partial [Gammaproteobacteria bacterium]